MTRCKSCLHLLVKGLNVFKYAHQMLDFDAELQLLQQELKDIDVLDRRNVCLDANVDRKQLGHRIITSGPMIVNLTLIHALGLEDDGE